MWLYIPGVAEMAKDYGVALPTIRAILNGRSWKHAA
jgi:hypothetical protein